MLSAVGEIDVLTLPVLRAALDDALGRAPRHLVVDLSAVLFCSACAFDVLADGARTAAANGSGYAVAGMSPHQDRVATLVWGERGPRRYLSTAAAIIAVHDDRPA